MPFAFYSDKETITGAVYEIRGIKIDLQKNPYWEDIDFPQFYDSEDSVWNSIANEGKVEAAFFPELSPREIFDVIREMDYYSLVVVKVTSPEVNNGIFHFEEVVKHYMIRKHEVKNCKVLIDTEKGYQNLPHENIN